MKGFLCYLKGFFKVCSFPRFFSSVIQNERKSRSDRVTDTITFERKKQQQKDKQNVSEHKSIEEQLNEVTLKRKRSIINSKTVLIITNVIKTKTAIIENGLKEQLL